MNKRNCRKSFEAGEKSCAICGDSLPAFESNSQPSYACAKDACRRTLYAALIPKKTRTIAEGEVICSLPGCTRPVPPGTFQERKKLFFCTKVHGVKYYKRTLVGQCKCCGKDIYDNKFMLGKREFLSRGHRLQYLSQQRIFEVAGSFAEIINKFMDGDGKLNYAATSWRSARNALIAFFGWAQSQNILDINGITPDTITDYMLHQRERGLTLDGYLGQISAFFTWARGRGYRKGASPIIPRFHRARQSKSVPRDYSVAEVAAILAALDKRGTTMMKLVVAIGLESGCRISETGGLRLGDINWERQTLFISKSKNGTQRHTFFDVNTRTYLELWLKERDPHCGHDFLFYTSTLAPITFSGCLQTLIKRTICKSKEFPEGVPSFSSHRLRHTWASALSNGGMDPTCLMPLGGWKCWTSMQRYVNTSETRVEAQYHESHQRNLEDQKWSAETLTSLDDLVAESGCEQE